MTNYHLTPPATIPSLAVREAREKRRKQLQQAQERRRVIYQRFRERMKQDTPSEFDTA